MHIRLKSGFLLKGVGALALVALGDTLFWVGDGFGSNIGVFAIAWTLVTVATAAAIWRDWRALGAGALAALLSLVLFDHPGFVALLMFAAALAAAAILPRLDRFGHVGRWLVRLFLHGIVSVIGPWRDLFRLRASRRRIRRTGMRALLPLLPLPLVGGAVFMTLFASANPIIGDWIAQIGLPEIDAKTIVRVILWGLLLTMVWATLRPRRLRIWNGDEVELLPDRIPGVSIGSVTLSLALFNALFALQNGLDLAFLWSGAKLPHGMTMAAYAHQGAYPLIITALLAGLFVLITLRPGSETASAPLIRRLVVLWVVQNVLLVASSILRTLDYIAAYSLTQWRIAALVWMGLVAVGLVLILWRMLSGKSATWLINANAAAAGLLLIGCSVIDIGAVAAAWNVRHAKEVGGQGAELDLCYLNELGPSALVSLVELEQHKGLDPAFAERLAWVRATTLNDVIEAQATGRWTWRNARRLEQIAPAVPTLRYGAGFDERNMPRQCDGSVVPPEPVADPANDPELENAIAAANASVADTPGNAAADAVTTAANAAEAASPKPRPLTKGHSR